MELFVQQTNILDFTDLDNHKSVKTQDQQVEDFMTLLNQTIDEKYNKMRKVVYQVEGQDEIDTSSPNISLGYKEAAKIHKNGAKHALL